MGVAAGVLSAWQNIDPSDPGLGSALSQSFPQPKAGDPRTAGGRELTVLMSQAGLPPPDDSICFYQPSVSAVDVIAGLPGCVSPHAC